jgi:hypothetical protein
VLGVVEDEQRPAPGEERRDRLLGRPPARIPQTEPAGDRRCDQGGVGDRRQRDEPAAVGERAGQGFGQPDGQPRLPHPARPDQCDEPDVRTDEEVPDRRQHLFASDEGRQRQGKRRRLAGNLGQRRGDGHRTAAFERGG